MIWNVVFFPPKGERHSPFDYIASNRKVRSEEKAQVARRIEVIKEREPTDWPTSWIHQIEGKIYQLSAGQLRLMFFLDRRTIVFVNAFRKKSKKTPRNEIERAWEHYRRYLGKNEG